MRKYGDSAVNTYVCICTLMRIYGDSAKSESFRITLELANENLVAVLRLGRRRITSVRADQCHLRVVCYAYVGVARR